MKTILCVFLCLIALSAEARSLKVITYNAYLLCIGRPNCLLKNSPDIEKRTHEIAQWLRQQDADIVFLQEVWRQDQFDTILKESGYAYGVFAGSNSEQAILSKFPLQNSGFKLLSWQASKWFHCRLIAVGARAGLFTAEVTVDGQTILLANTHALPRDPSIAGYEQPSDEASVERELHLLELSTLLDQRPENTKIIFGADFNMNQTSEEYQFWKKLGWVDTLKEKSGAEWKDLCTYCEESPLVRQQGNRGEGILDYIFVKSGEFQINDSRIIKESDAFSDHRAVVTVLETVPANATPNRTIVDPADIKRFEDHVRSTKINAWCYLAPSVALGQRRSAQKFLKSLSR